MATHIHTPDELGELLRALLAGAAGGTKGKWAAKEGAVEKLPIATNVRSNWRATPSGRAADKNAIAKRPTSFVRSIPMSPDSLCGRDPI
jgi:hypothetical protein